MTYILTNNSSELITDDIESVIEQIENECCEECFDVWVPHSQDSSIRLKELLDTECGKKFTLKEMR